MSEASAASHWPYTWDDYRSWSDGERWEIIGGAAYAMSPAPTPRHQGIQAELVRQLGNHFRQRARVQEVWLVTPFPPCVEVFKLDRQGYRRHAAYIQTQVLTSPAFPGLAIELASVFDFPLETGDEPLVVREPPVHYAPGETNRG